MHKLHTGLSRCTDNALCDVGLRVHHIKALFAHDFVYPFQSAKQAECRIILGRCAPLDAKACLLDELLPQLVDGTAGSACCVF